MKTRAKTIAESRVYEFQFQQEKELAKLGAILASVTSVSVSPAGLTVGGASIGAASDPPNLPNSSVFMRISGGVAATRYFFRVTALTDSGTTLEVPGVLSIVEPELPTV